MRKKILLFMLTVTLFLGIMPAVYGTQSGPVRISLPGFKVTLNGQVIHNDYSKYPLIVYKDITYFPMTFNDCRYLGIESTWKGDKEGLSVDATNVTAAYNPYTSSQKNGRAYTADIPGFPIKVNGKSVDNSKEEFPLLYFRDITYFPMTWKYGATEFGWDYSFDNVNGLVIKSKNKKLTQTDLSKDRPKLVGSELNNDYPNRKSSSVLVKNGYVYYEGNKGAIMQAPLNDTSKTKKVHQLNLMDVGYGGGQGLYDSHSLYEENGKAMLYFHSGGAVMGSDHKLELNADGSTRKIQESYDETTAYGDKLFSYYMGPTPGPGNLRVRNFNDDESEALGSPDYWYYGLTRLGGLPNITLVGNQLYVRAAPVLKHSNISVSDMKLGNIGIYKVNLDTNEVVKVSGTADPVTQGQIEGDYLYYLSKENVYKVSLKNGTETLIGKADGTVEYSTYELSFAVMGGKPYFTKKDKNLYTMDNSVSVNPNAELLRMSVTGSNKEYLACTFKESAASKYRIMVFDQEGKVVFKTSDCGSNVVVEGNTLYFYNITTEKLCSTRIG